MKFVVEVCEQVLESKNFEVDADSAEAAERVAVQLAVEDGDRLSWRLEELDRWANVVPQ